MSTILTRESGKLSARHFDWDLLKSFLGVIDHGSLSAASRALAVSQPTLGRHISELEAALGVILFDRGREGLAPTHAALAIVEEARGVADGAGRIALAAAGKASEVSGTVRVTASEIVATYLLPAILGRMLADMPAISVELVASNAVENLLRRDADIAVRMVEPSQLDLVSRKLVALPMGVFAHRDYLDRHGRPSTPADLSGHVVIGFDRSDLILRGFRAAGFDVDRSYFRFRCDDQVAAWEALAAGAGIGFAPLWLARRCAQLERIAPEFKVPPLTIWLVTHKEVRTSARIRAAYDYLAQAILDAGLDADPAN